VKQGISEAKLLAFLWLNAISSAERITVPNKAKKPTQSSGPFALWHPAVYST
jgi:hypothetical protein